MLHRYTLTIHLGFRALHGTFSKVLWFIWSSMKLLTTLAVFWKWKSCHSWMSPKTHKKLQRPQIFIFPNHYQRTQQTTREISEPFHRFGVKLKAAALVENKTKSKTLQGTSASRVFSFHWGFEVKPLQEAKYPWGTFLLLPKCSVVV